MSNDLVGHFGGGRAGSSKADGARRAVAEDDDMGPSVSMAVEAEDDEHFRQSTFNLKRTRSMGLLDGHSESPSAGPASPEVDSYSSPVGPSESTSPPAPEADSFMVPHDDNDIMHEPKRHVDYLSHEWKESEISQSWKYIILKKKKKNEDLVNAARLENASWRTWAKARNHLRTVSPETVNWSKDSDVTWLYGPVVRQKSSEQDASSDVEYGYGSDDETSKRLTTLKPKKRALKGPKPILKKRTVSEIIEENSRWKLNVARQHKKNLSSTQALMDGYGNNLDAADDYDALAARVNAQYYSSNEVPSSASSTHDDRIDYQELQLQEHANEGQSPYSGEAEDSVSTSRPVSSSNRSPAPALESILTSPSKRTPKNANEQRDRHIHFNDRVEQCMALAITSNNDDDDFDDDDDNYSFDDDAVEGSAHHEFTNTKGSRSRRDDKSQHLGAESDQDLDSSSSDEEEAGLFINARLSKKSEGSHASADASSTSAESSSIKSLTTPIIKPLPATTLNYGSDEEDFDDDDEYYGSNAVSHNVNTFRGYDYMYDYNSVYTGDTSSFMAANDYDMVDVPEGLRTPIEEHDAHSSLIDQGSDEDKLPSEPIPKKRFSLDSDTDSYGSNGESQFIEDSRNRSSDEDDDTADLESLPPLKRTPSLGVSTPTSLQDLQLQSPSIPQTHSFITGKPLRQINQPWDAAPKESSSFKTAASKPAKKFSFDSDSGSDSCSDSKEEDADSTIQELFTRNHYHENENEDVIRRNQPLSLADTSSKGVQSSYNDPTHGTAVSPISRPQGQRVPSESLMSMVSTTGDSRTSLSDVAISGYISPRNESMHSVVAKEKMTANNKSTSADVEHINKNLEKWHLNPHDHDEDDPNSENVQKMMSSAREIASKYLHSWKK
ncbi:LAME_0F04830g1_1 [Lachancea meyersii CBS 8951]|uniref:LAME_0F04830g1_1 n=1 Tax=Lachancea meyersii CBS 8951 TaxID=1266667 RepID=A0A1G4JSB8_9SACH|nr:LAME_0F04830g1_1 [Lachancea meyersii CBS 8951]